MDNHTACEEAYKRGYAAGLASYGQTLTKALKERDEARARWISVKDRLPSGYIVVDPETNFKEPAEYIVHVSGAMVATVGMFNGEKFVPSLFNGDTKWCGDVDYWMPLPEPPEVQR